MLERMAYLVPWSGAVRLRVRVLEKNQMDRRAILFPLPHPPPPPPPVPPLPPSGKQTWH